MSGSFELEQGQKISHFCIDKKLGEGGMGAVYLAEDLTLSRLVAIKFMNRSQVAQNTSHALRNSLEKRFIREAKSAAAINHPNIAQIYEANFETDTWYIAMEYIEGQSLYDQMQEGKIYTSEEVISICKQTIYGLDHAWSKYKIIHRDIKPHNLMLTSEGLIKIVDLGLAKPLEEQNDASQTIELTRAGTPLGTPPYMAPEQAAGNKEINFSADVFSLGATLYELLAGQKAFNEKSAPMVYMSQIQKKYIPLREINAEILPGLIALIDSMLEPKVEDRISSYREIQMKLENVLHHPPLTPGADQNASTTLTCSHCNQKIALDKTTMQGQEVNCPKCNATINVPGSHEKKTTLAGQSPKVFSPSKPLANDQKTHGLILEFFSPEERIILEQEYGIEPKEIGHLKWELSWESGVISRILKNQIKQWGESNSKLEFAMQIQSELKQQRHEYHQFIKDQFQSFVSLHKSLTDTITQDLEIALRSNELTTIFGFSNKTESLLSKLKQFHETVMGKKFPKDKLSLDVRRAVFDWAPIKLSKSLFKEPLYKSDHYAQLHQILLSWMPFCYEKMNRVVEQLCAQEVKNRNSVPLDFQFSFLPSNFYQFYRVSRELNIGFHRTKSLASNG